MLISFENKSGEIILANNLKNSGEKHLPKLLDRKQPEKFEQIAGLLQDVNF